MKSRTKVKMTQQRDTFATTAKIDKLREIKGWRRCECLEAPSRIHSTSNIKQTSLISVLGE